MADNDTTAMTEAQQELLEALEQLDAAFFGTMIPREPGEHPRSDMKRGPDGWRHGVSHPFTYRGLVYDVQRTPSEATGAMLFNGDVTRAVYQMLRRTIVGEFNAISMAALADAKASEKAGA